MQLCSAISGAINCKRAFSTPSPPYNTLYHWFYFVYFKNASKKLQIVYSEMNFFDLIANTWKPVDSRLVRNKRYHKLDEIRSFSQVRITFITIKRCSRKNIVFSKFIAVLLRNQFMKYPNWGQWPVNIDCSHPPITSQWAEICKNFPSYVFFLHQLRICLFCGFYVLLTEFECKGGALLTDCEIAAGKMHCIFSFQHKNNQNLIITIQAKMESQV